MAKSIKKSEPTSVTLQMWRPSLDWFEIKEVEVPLNQGYSFEMQFRLGSWFLMFFKWDEKQGRSINHYHLDFELYQPHVAVNKLGKRIRAFTKMHETDLSEPLIKLLQRAAEENAHQQGTNHVHA